MATPTPVHTPVRSQRPLWRRLLAAQEFGLVLVIIVLVIGLTTYTHLRAGPIAKTDFFPQPPGSALTVSDDGSTFTITPPGGSASAGAAAARTYATAQGWAARDTGERIILSRRVEVNKFLNKDNILAVLTAASFIAVMAVGMTGIIVMGGIDLSVGSIYALSAIIGAMVLNKLGAGDAPVGALVSVPIGLLVCCGIGALCGLVNGSAVVGLGVHPFIITLGGMAVYRGIAFVTTEGLSIGDFPVSFVKGFFKAEVWGVSPVPMLVMILTAGAGVFVLSRTVFGRRVFAVGGNEIAARYAGVPVGRVKIIMFTLCGALAGLSAAMLLGYYGAGTSDAGKGYELSVIAAAVVGGASLSGGRGSALGAVLGAVVIQLIDNSIIMLDINQSYKEIVIGLAIVVAVVVDQAKQRLTAKR
ncbi:MAG: ABC transporter permease [Phycisphaerae bacterium]|nr:ABC transporter permease [Phycisphaerae bacterium]